MSEIVVLHAEIVAQLVSDGRSHDGNGFVVVLVHAAGILKRADWPFERLADDVLVECYVSGRGRTSGD